MHLGEILSGIILLLLIFGGALYLRSRWENNESRKYFVPALTFKIFCAIFFAALYQFHYVNQDASDYFKAAQYILQTFHHNSSEGIALLGGNPHSLLNSNFSDNLSYVRWLGFYLDPSGYMVVRFTTLATFLGLGSYWNTSILMSLFCFWGTWLLFRSFAKKFPEYHKWLALSILFFPSFTFWASGISKESIAVGSMGYFIYVIYKLIFYRKNFIIFSILMVIGLYLIFIVKPYFLIPLLPTLALGFGWEKMKDSGMKFPTWKKFSFVPLLIFLGVGAAYLLSSRTEKFNFSSLLYYIWSQRTATVELSPTSAIIPIDFKPTWLGVLKASPEALWRALFRPYIWESKNIFMLMAALECTLLFLLTLFIIWKTGAKKIIQLIRTQPIFISSILFIILFSVPVGLATCNLGSLSRYRIPVLPFYGIALTLMYGMSQKKNNQSVQ